MAQSDHEHYQYCFIRPTFYLDIPGIPAVLAGSCKVRGDRQGGGGASERAGCEEMEHRPAWSEGRELTSAGERELVMACLAEPGCWRPGLVEVQSLVWRMVVEVHQLEVWRRWSWSQAREPQAGQSVEDLMEVRPEQSIEVQALVEAESQAHHQDNLVPGVEGTGDNCSVVWVLQ